MWIGSIKFINETDEKRDKDGFANCGEVYSESVPASFADVTRNDEILAAQKGYTAHRNIEVAACNYNGEEQLLDERDGAIYDIKRTHQKDKSMNIILTCERRQHGTICD